MTEATQANTRIVRVAKELVERENTTGWGYEIGSPEHHEGPVWRLLVRWLPPDGSIFDGPGLIYVDEEKLKAWFVETC